MANRPVRTAISYAVVFLFLVSFLWAGLQHGLHGSVLRVLALGELPLFFSELSLKEDFKGFPDFGHLLYLKTITATELSLDERRLIFVGDIHGMKSSLDKLLSKVKYDPSRDVLLHLGDIIAKGPDSLKVLSQFSEANVTGVRGNHEQSVIEWRAWIEWVEGQHGGKGWLKKLEHKYPHGFHSKKHKHKHKLKLKWSIPKRWEFKGDHYGIARRMTASQFAYLKSLPLVIHLPSLHTLVVHAGILPFDPKYPPDDSRQPLAHVPTVSSQSSYPTRTAQERSLLTDIKRNADPWVLLNMRTILRNGKVSRKVGKGTPWSELWDMVMKQCHGYHHFGITESIPLGRQDESGSASLQLSCLPINIVFGHYAARGLDIKRWSFGLDDGCVKGRHLTAMLISNPTNFMPVADAKIREVRFGEHGQAQLVSVRCPKHGSKSLDS